MAAAAYAALLALARSLQDILDLQQYHVDPHLHKEKIHSLHGKVDFIITFLEDYSDKYHETLGCVGNGIRKAAYEAQDFMDSYYCYLSKSTDDYNWRSSNANLDRDLTMAFERIDFIWEETILKMKNSDTTTSQDLPSVSYINSSPVHHSSTAKKMVVGFDDDLNAIKERLFEDASELQIIPIVGMGGIGKTTLARRAYEDQLFSQYFDICAWITVSQEYQRSRILLTTRILDVAAHAGSSSSTLFHQMNGLNEDQSWTLLQERVFGQQSACPVELVEVGKKIAKNCGGLPLTIVVVAGLLLSSGDVMREQVWENISENISSREPTIALQCSKILCFSYDRLPLRLKPCFLYIAAFPEDSEIDVSKLIKLWVAEGFLKPNDELRWLEDVGERYLEELVNRSLLLVSKKGPDGKLETVGIHDMLREICIRKAEEEGFLHLVSPSTEFTDDLFRDWKITTGSSLRSFLLFFKRDSNSKLYILSRHVYILDTPQVSASNSYHIIAKLVNLRYLAFKLNNIFDSNVLLDVITKLPNLETIVAHVIPMLESLIKQVEVPYEILKMPKLRHLIWDKPFRLSYPSDTGIVHESDLQTIETVGNFIFAEETIKILVNLKKLKCSYTLTNRNRNWDDFNLNNLFHLQNLEDLEIFVRYNPSPSMIWNHAFPIGLKKLSLKRVSFPWENMTIIGLLPNLQVLEMIEIEVTQVSEWTTVEGQFLQLKYFRSSLDYLAKWETEKEHFPCLESLILQDVKFFNEIPSGIGEIDTLQYIELRYGKKSLVNSAKQIQRLQHENGNDAFRVRVIDLGGYDVSF